MNYVEPIRDLDVLESMCRYLKERNERNYILFLMGIYTGLRVSDILRFRIRDLKGKQEIRIREGKTNKRKSIPFNPILKKALEAYYPGKELNDYLIKSRQGYNQPISRQMAYVILSDLGESFGVEGLGTHSMRKTFGYHYYQKTKDVALLQTIFNHSTPGTTLRYIGIAQDDIDKAYRNFKYF
ncbi:site-specific integrase [Tindallia californiensis]|uniref:Phage integrase family protein n=1 Tax=Tindallia californiensis TaxID=159292 RepID=A0A1H3R1A6_9FIRM|nr:site-specific integrase [Tindallia californiensis]SDZ19091.1 Phage integrase family protein [Tindallia californiensis]